MEESEFFIENFSHSQNEQLTEVEILGQKSGIGLGAFYACPNLRRLVLGQNVNYIAPLAFAECKKLLDVEVGQNVVAVAENAFGSECGGAERVFLKNPAYKNQGGIAFNEKLRSILFAANKGLTKIAFPKNTRSIGWYAFRNCAALQEIAVPETVEWIGEKAFSGCVSLKKISLTNSVRQIEQAAFMGCAALQEFKVPKYLDAIESFAFSGCENLSKIEIPLTVRRICEKAFEFCPSLKKVTVSKWCVVEDGAFESGVEVHRL